MKKVFILLLTVLVSVSVIGQAITSTETKTTNKVTNYQYTYVINELNTIKEKIIEEPITVTVQNNDRLKVVQKTEYELYYCIYDIITNQAIVKNCIRTEYDYINFNSFQPGQYRIQFIDRKGAEKNFKVVKK